MNDVLVVLAAALLAFTPVVEVRGAIPLVIALASNKAVLIVGLVASVISNIAVAPAAFKLLELLDKIVARKRVPEIIRKVYVWILSFGRKRAGKLGAASYVALALFVGVPLPATGAWTGALVAFILGMNRVKATLAIAAGVVIASAIVFVASYLGLELLKKIFLL